MAEKPSSSENSWVEHACDATRMLDKRRQLFDIKERFDAEKEDHAKRCEELRLKEEDLAKRDLAFQAKMVKFKIFSRENDLKQKRLAQRLADEVNIFAEMDKEAAVLTESLEEKRRKLEDLKKEVERGKKYRDLLGSNLDVEDLLERFESSKRCRERLEGKMRRLKEIEEDRVAEPNAQSEGEALTATNVDE